MNCRAGAQIKKRREKQASPLRVYRIPRQGVGDPLALGIPRQGVGDPLALGIGALVSGNVRLDLENGFLDFGDSDRH